MRWINGSRGCSSNRILCGLVNVLSLVCLLQVLQQVFHQGVHASLVLLIRLLGSTTCEVASKLINILSF